MDGFWYHMMYGYPYSGMLIWMFVVWIVQLIVGYLVYQDARGRRMNAGLWFVLVILPMIGWLFLVIYVIIRETRGPEVPPTVKSALQILDERYAKGEISAEEYQRMKEDLRK
ncbi:MAG: SHOCT domain-containing protein [Methanomicrobiales archaeon]|nr:SHOCT domain-containing protein [Methanomicrobiales archaeon]